VVENRKREIARVPDHRIAGTRSTTNRQTPEFLARLVEEKHRAKLAKDGSDTH
jgi:hypothetical protein